MKTNNDISIVIVNYNSAHFTEKCLESIYENAGTVPPEIIVIDNASFDGCDQVVRQRFPEVIYLQSAANLGFAKANNRAAERARGKYILFLNPDTEVRGKAINSLRNTLEAHPDAGMAGARLLNSDLSVQTTSITAFPSIANQILGTDYLRRKLPTLPLWGMQALFENRTAPVRVDAISGACMLVRKDVFHDIQGFTSEYFMYAEDIDLCLKAKQAGWNTYYVPEAVILHHGGQSSASRAESNYASVMIRESMHRFMRVHRGTAYSAAYRLVIGLAAACRLLLIGITAPFAVRGDARKGLQSRADKWFSVLAWSLGLAAWATRERKRGQQVQAPIAG